MIKYLSMRYKFLVMASLGVLAIATLSFLAFDITEKGVFNVNKVFEDSKRVQTIQQSYILPLFKLRELSLSLVMAPNEDLRKGISEQLSLSLAQMEPSFSLLDEAIYKRWLNYVGLLSATQAYLDYGFEEGAFISANTLERDQFYALMNALEILQRNELQNSSDTFNEANRQAINSKYFITSWLAVVVLLTLLFGFLIAKNIVDSIQKEIGRASCRERVSSPV